MEKLITSSEARRRLNNMSSSTFKIYVDSGRIRKVTPPGKAQGKYIEEDVNKLAQELKPFMQEEKAVNKRRNSKTRHAEGETDWVQSSDLPYLLALDYEMYGPEITVDISITHTWWTKNPYMCRILFNKEDRRDIWGAITIMPMEEKTILKILREEIEEKQIKQEDILTYEKGKKYYGYIASAIIKPDHKESFFRLLESVLNFWCSQYPDIQFIKFYTLAASEAGWDLIKKLFFAPRPDLGEKAFELDLNLRNPSRPVTHFQKCLKERQVQSTAAR